MEQPFFLDGYALTDLIGFGATGEVWRGRDETTHEPVALKRLWEPATEGLVLRLRQDAAIVAEVAGPHAVRILEVAALPGGEVVLVMECAEGGSLAGLLARRGRLHPSEVVTVLGPLAQTLADLHRRGLVHGDVTPANVLFAADGRPMLADVGLAIATGERPGDDIGCRDPAYDAAAGPPTAAGDCFGLAALGYAALTGVPPRSASHPGLIEPIVGRAPWVPAPLAAAIEAALAPDPATRPDVAGFGAAVLAACGAAPVRLTGPRRSTEPDAATTVAPPARRPRRLVAVGMAAAVLVIAALVGVGSARLNTPSAAALQPAPSSAAAAPEPHRAPTRSEWKQILGNLDALRAKAWRAGDPRLLADVYWHLPRTDRVDYFALRLLAQRNLRAPGFTDTVVSVTPLYELPTDAQLKVVDRLAPYSVVDQRGHVVARYQGDTHAFAITLRYREHRWWVRDVTAP